MIDPMVGAAIGGVVGSSVGQPINSLMGNWPMTIKVGLLIVILGFALWWYLGATHRTRQRIRKATKRS